MDEVHKSAFTILDQILENFGLSRSNSKSPLILEGETPAHDKTKSDKLDLSLLGALLPAANAVAAAEIYELRGGQPQEIHIDLRRGHAYIDPDIGMTPSMNGQEFPLDVVVGNPFLYNIFTTADGRSVVISAVYVDLVYKWLIFLGCSPAEDEVREAVKKWKSDALSEAAASAGLPMSLVYGEEEWVASPQGSVMAKLPMVPVEKKGNAGPTAWPSGLSSRPLSGIRVLCVTHAIAGPSAGRTLAEHGASVLQVMFSHGFEHHFVYNSANLGCASARLNFHKAADVERMWSLIKEADVWIDSYREGAVSKFGFSDDSLLAQNPSLIITHVRCFGTHGPWANRPGFDMQGSAASGIMAYCGDGPLNPKWAPGMVINDYSTGMAGSLAIQATLIRRAQEGGGYILSPSLTGTAMSILKHFKTKGKSSNVEPLPPMQIEGQTPLGYLKTWAPLPVMSITQPRYDPILLVPMGSSPPVFPGFDLHWNPAKEEPRSKEKFREDVAKSAVMGAAKIKKIGQAYRDKMEP